MYLSYFVYLYTLCRSFLLAGSLKQSLYIKHEIAGKVCCNL